MSATPTPRKPSAPTNGTGKRQKSSSPGRRVAADPHPSVAAPAAGTTIAVLTHDPENIRRRTPRGHGVIVESLQRLGAARSIAIDEHNVILAGNGVVEAAGEAGIHKLRIIDTDGDEIIAVRRRGLSKAQKRLLAITDNRATDLSADDPLALRGALEGLPADLLKPFDLYRPAELEALYGSVVQVSAHERHPGEDDVPPERPTDIKRGDVFALGRHRVMCGDSTNQKDVERLMNKQEVDLILSDPPYCSGGFQESGKSQGSKGTKGPNRAVANDTISTRGYRAMMKDVLARFDRAALCYLFTDWRMWVNLFDLCESAGFGVRNMIVWDKGTPGMGQGWRSQHELVMFGSRGPGKFNPKLAQGNVIQCQRSGNKYHATEKPVELLETVLRTTAQACSVADPFLGSGSTMVAAEIVGMPCFGMELKPGILQVAIDRWEAFTGKKAESISAVA